ncbi:MAG: cytochrome P450 [Chthoniobacter sp.]|uniref:cytochrome P450 n=1 Tax=Chthoniobacter sp. TaxID=2510640 RepID=UPI0032A43FAD
MDPEQIDPFEQKRKEAGVLPCDFEGERVPMILRHADVKAATKDWHKFSSDAPRRLSFPTEEEVRSMRQFPLEVDPPQQTESRKLVEPYFARPKLPEVIAQVEALARRLVADALRQDSIELVRDFAVVYQSKALTYMLNMPEAEADVWISWGTHVYRDVDAAGKVERGRQFEAYLHSLFDKALAHPGEDLFSYLNKATFQGRPMMREEAMGIANLAFAGGRDTVINAVTASLGYLGGHAEALEYLRQDPKRIVNACEELFRYISPLTHIGRVCPIDTEVMGVPVKPKGKVSLCWSSANYDETIFPNPHEVHLDRKPNAHMAFGFGLHLCLGAPQARLVLRSLMKALCEQVQRIEILKAEPHFEVEAEYRRAVGYDALRARLIPLNKSAG